MANTMMTTGRLPGPMYGGTFEGETYTFGWMHPDAPYAEPVVTAGGYVPIKTTTPVQKMPKAAHVIQPRRWPWQRHKHFRGNVK